jgi:hypothetical protein
MSTEEQTLSAALCLSRMETRAPEPAPDPGAEIAGQLYGGRSLDEGTRGLMESRFGENFSEVQVHTGHHAAQLAADLESRAFTVGEDIVFAEGQFAPETTEGQRLLAHELAHVVQQRRPAGPMGGERETERDAREAAREVAGGGTPRVTERAAPGSIQKDDEGGRAVPAATNPQLGGPGMISVSGMVVGEVTTSKGGDPGVEKVSAWEWGPNNENLRITVVVRMEAGPTTLDTSRWKNVQWVVQKSIPSVKPAPPPPLKAPPKVRQVGPSSKPKPKPQPTPKTVDVPPPQVVPEIVITAEGDVESDQTAVSPPVPDQRPVAEQVVTSLTDDPAKAAHFAPQLTDTDLVQFTARDRVELLDALATNAEGALDIPTVLRVIQTTPIPQQRDLLDALVAKDGKVLANLRNSVAPSDRNSLEGALFQLQLSEALRAGQPGIGPNLFDPLGARGFQRPVWGGSAPLWARDLQFRREANGDWTMQALGQAPLIIEGPLTRAARAARLNDQIASTEARGLSPQGKVNRIKQLTENVWTGSGDEERIIDILRFTPASEAPNVLQGLENTQSGGQPLLDRLDSAVDLENNVLLHAQLSALRLRARQNDPNLISDIAKAPVLPWRDAFFHNRAVFVVRKLPDGNVEVTYGALQSFELESSEAFGAAMKALPKEMQHGGTLVLKPNDIVIVNDLDGDRQVPLTAADLVAFHHSGNRGLIKHMANVASVVVPVGLAARGTIGIGQAALEVGGAVLAMTADEYRMEITKWSPGLMHAIDVVNIALAIKGGIDIARLGVGGARALYSGLKKEYSLFQARKALMAASGDAKAARAAQIADAQAQELLQALDSAQKQPPTKARLAPPTDDYDVEAWKAYYEQNPDVGRSVGAASANDPSFGAPKARVDEKIVTEIGKEHDVTSVLNPDGSVNVSYGDKSTTISLSDKTGNNMRIARALGLSTDEATAVLQDIRGAAARPRKLLISHAQNRGDPVAFLKKRLHDPTGFWESDAFDKPPTKGLRLEARIGESEMRLSEYALVFEEDAPGQFTPKTSKTTTVTEFQYVDPRTGARVTGAAVRPRAVVRVNDAGEIVEIVDHVIPGPAAEAKAKLLDLFEKQGWKVNLP